jgi:hypothetical protein
MISVLLSTAANSVVLALSLASVSLFSGGLNPGSLGVGSLRIYSKNHWESSSSS